VRGVALEILPYNGDRIGDAVAVFNRETEGESFIVPLTADLFVRQITSKPYFADEGCFLAYEDRRAIGLALTAPGIDRSSGGPRHDTASVDGLFFPKPRLDVGDALLDKCLTRIRSDAWISTVYGFASYGGYPYWRGLYCGAEPVCLTSHDHVWSFMARGFVHHQQSMNFLGRAENRPQTGNLTFEESDLGINGDWSRATWRGHHPKVIRALRDGAVVGRLGYAELPFLSAHRGRRIAGIYSLHVEEALRRRGIASALMDDLYSRVSTNGIEEILVGTTVDNAAARATYEKAGMAVVGSRTGTMLRLRA